MFACKLRLSHKEKLYFVRKIGFMKILKSLGISKFSLFFKTQKYIYFKCLYDDRILRNINNTENAAIVISYNYDILNEFIMAIKKNDIFMT